MPLALQHSLQLEMVEHRSSGFIHTQEIGGFKRMQLLPSSRYRYDDIIHFMSWHHGTKTSKLCQLQVIMI